MSFRSSLAAVAILFILGCGLAIAYPAVDAAAPVSRWPYSTLQLGLVNNQNSAAALRASAPFGLRYHYLSGGVNTRQDWTGWATGHGAFVTDYVNESLANAIVPVFSYYNIRQSLPGAKIADEATGDLANLHNVATMRAYFRNVQTMFGLLGATAAPTIVVHVEPDLWGYVEQTAGDDAASEPAAVASTGLPLLKGLPNNVAGVAQAFVRLRNTYAPHVLLAYQLSVFGTDKDLHTSSLTDPDTIGIAEQSTAFYRSLHASFDMVFGEFTNSDAGYQQTVLKQPNPFWGPADYARQLLYLGTVHHILGLPLVLWQIPVGNMIYRTDNNTPGHYQDNRVQWLLGAGYQSRLQAYARVGVVALLFGSGVASGTCACDARHDGITNPPAIDGNTTVSTSRDDDGGYLMQQARAYYKTPEIRITF